MQIAHWGEPSPATGAFPGETQTATNDISIRETITALVITNQRFPGALPENDPNELWFLNMQLLPPECKCPSAQSSELSGLSFAEPLTDRAWFPVLHRGGI